MNSPNSPSTRRSYFAREALLPTGWHKNVLMTVADNGTFIQVTPAATEEPESERVGVVLPGMVNLHSHSFQRAMAGLAERRGPLTDSFGPGVR